jgi:hypothetical protein
MSPNGDVERTLCHFSVEDHAFRARLLPRFFSLIGLLSLFRRGSETVSQAKTRQERERWEVEGWDSARQTQPVGILEDKVNDRVIEAHGRRSCRAEWFFWRLR